MPARGMKRERRREERKEGRDEGGGRKEEGGRRGRREEGGERREEGSKALNIHCIFIFWGFESDDSVSCFCTRHQKTSSFQRSLFKKQMNYIRKAIAGHLPWNSKTF